MNRKTYKRITYEDRRRIEEMASRGMDKTSIAAAIGVHFQTISRELKRGGNPYKAEKAQKNLGLTGSRGSGGL